MILTLVVGGAAASGLDAPAVGSTFASPVSADAAAVALDPAMLSHLERGVVSVSLGLVGGRLGYRRYRLGRYQSPDTLRFEDPVGDAWIDPSLTGPAEPVAAGVFSPWGSLFWALPVDGGRFAIGGGVYVPYAAPLAFPDDGPQRFALQEVFLAVTHVAGSAAWRPHPRISLGGSLIYVSGLAELARVQDFAGVDFFGDVLGRPPINQPNSFGLDAPSTVRELDVLARPFTLTDARSHGVDFTLAVAAEPVDGTLIAATWHHGSRMRLRGDFALDLDDPFFTRDLAAQGLQYEPLVTGQAELSFRLPSRAGLALGHHLSDEVRVDLVSTLVLWHTFDAFDLTLTSPDLAQPALDVPPTATTALPRAWRDTVHLEASARLGLRQRVSGSITAGVHTGASPQATVDVASPDGTRLVGAGGAGFRVSERTRVVVDGEIQALLPRTVTESDFDLGNGVYNLFLGSLGGHLEWVFGKSTTLTP